MSHLKCFPRGQQLCVNSAMAVQNYKLRYLFGISMSILEILISQSKVGNFANIVVIKKNITSCQVTMDYLQKENILHLKCAILVKKYRHLVIAHWKKRNTITGSL